MMSALRAEMARQARAAGKPQAAAEIAAELLNMVRVKLHCGWAARLVTQAGGRPVGSCCSHGGGRQR